jgi:hypothetical protein
MSPRQSGKKHPVRTKKKQAIVMLVFVLLINGNVNSNLLLLAFAGVER